MCALEPVQLPDLNKLVFLDPVGAADKGAPYHPVLGLA